MPREERDNSTLRNWKKTCLLVSTLNLQVKDHKPLKTTTHLGSMLRVARLSRSLTIPSYFLNEGLSPVHPHSLTRQSSWETGLLLPGWLMSQTLTQPFPPVYTCLVGLLMVTAHTTSPWFRVLIWRACRGMPGPMRASGGKGTGCIWPSAVTWKEYALLDRRWLERREDRRGNTKGIYHKAISYTSACFYEKHKGRFGCYDFLSKSVKLKYLLMEQI